MNETETRRDGLLHIELMGGMARALLCDSTGMCEAARATHGLSRVATAALGRLLTATAMLGAMLKGDKDSVTAALRGGGPLGTLMAVGKANGHVKGYVDNPDVDLPRRPDGKLPVGDAVGTGGYLSVIKDMGLREPYIGQTHIVSGEIAEDFAMYFTASEQVPSLVSLGVLTQDKVLAAGGLIVQMLPGADEAAIQSVELSAGMFTNISQTILEYGLDGAVAQLLLHLEPKVLGRLDIRHLCDCNRPRIEQALISLGKQELRSMIDEQGGAEVGCQFCGKKWRFSAEALESLLKEATRQ